MDNDSLIKLVILIFLIICSAFFSSAETALISCNKIRIESMALDGNKRAISVQKILSNQTKMLGTILVGNNIANIGASSLSTALTLKHFGNFAVSITAGILTLIILIWGEIMPKSIATIHANKISLLYSPIIRFLTIILTPIVFFINKVSNILIKLLKLDKTNDKLITEQEFKALVDVGHKEGVLEAEEKDIINNLLEFTDASAESIMTPRIDMIFVNINDDYNTVIDIFRTHRYTRLPVYKKIKDEVCGIINIKDLLMVENKEDFKVADYIREPFFTYESKSIPELLYEMKKASVNIVIILDEYGITSGLITLEDLIEELIGEIRDEYDFDEFDDIIKNEDGTFTINAMIKLDDINEYFNLSLSGDGYDNLAGYITEELKHLPKVSETIIVDNLKFKVLSIQNNRLETVIATYINNLKD